MRTHFFEKYPGECNEPFIPGLAIPGEVEATDERQLLKWLTRVRKWKVDINIGYTDDVGDPHYTSFSGTVSDGEAQAAPPALMTTIPFGNELEKVCPRDTWLYEGAPTGPIQVLIGNYCKSAPTPIIQLQVFINSDGGHLSNYSSDPSPIASFVTGSFDGRPFSVYCVGSDTLDSAGTIEITPYPDGEGFWPYARSDDSLPLWDTDDGSNLIPTSDPEFIVVA